MRILIADPFDPYLPHRLKDFGEVTDDKTQLSTADVVLVRSKTQCTREYIDSAPALKMIIRGGVGLDNIDVVYARERGVKVLNTVEASSAAVAELTLAHMLGIPNRLIEGHITMSQGKWAKKELTRTEVFGKTLGIIGIGRIGREVAIRAKAFGMNVIAYDKYVETSEHADLISLPELLARADFISLHTPLTDETRGMVNAEVIAKMKDEVIIINTSRAGLIDEEALVAALERGKIRAYGTDVWESDPPPENCPLLRAKNVFKTPHIGSSSTENLLRIGDVIVRILEENYGRQLF
jgi:D-3-phosphoglycerate dehydrogenase